MCWSISKRDKHGVTWYYYRSTIACSSKNNSKNKKTKKSRKFRRQKNENRWNCFLQHFVTSKLFKVIFTDFFFAKKQKLRNSVFERWTLFFQKISIRLPGGEPAMVLWYRKRVVDRNLTNATYAYIIIDLDTQWEENIVHHIMNDIAYPWRNNCGEFLWKILQLWMSN